MTLLQVPVFVVESPIQVNSVSQKMAGSAQPQDLSKLVGDDVVGKAEIVEAQTQAEELNKTSKSVSDFELVMSFGSDYWKALASFNLKSYPLDHIKVSVPSKCAIMLEGRGRPLSPKQLKAALDASNEAESRGFSFVK